MYAEQEEEPVVMGGFGKRVLVERNRCVMSCSIAILLCVGAGVVCFIERDVRGSLGLAALAAEDAAPSRRLFGLSLARPPVMQQPPMTRNLPSPISPPNPSNDVLSAASRTHLLTELGQRENRLDVSSGYLRSRVANTDVHDTRKQAQDDGPISYKRLLTYSGMGFIVAFMVGWTIISVLRTTSALGYLSRNIVLAGNTVWRRLGFALPDDAEHTRELTTTIAGGGDPQMNIWGIDDLARNRVDDGGLECGGNIPASRRDYHPRCHTVVMQQKLAKKGARDPRDVKRKSRNEPRLTKSQRVRRKALQQSMQSRPQTPKPDGEAIDAPEAPFVLAVVRAAADRRATDVTALRVAHLTSATCFFVNMVGRNKPQLEAIVENIEDEIEKEFGRNAHRQGRAIGGWVCLDYDTVIVNILTPELHRFYDIDGNWKSAQKLDVSEIVEYGPGGSDREASDNLVDEDDWSLGDVDDWTLDDDDWTLDDQELIEPTPQQAAAEASEVVSEDVGQATSETDVLRAALEADECDEVEEEEEEAELVEQVIPAGVVQAALFSQEGVDEEKSEEAELVEQVIPASVVQAALFSQVGVDEEKSEEE